MPTLEIATTTSQASALEVEVDQRQADEFLAWFRGANPDKVFTFEASGTTALVQKSAIALVRVWP